MNKNKSHFILLFAVGILSGWIIGNTFDSSKERMKSKQDVNSAPGQESAAVSVNQFESLISNTTSHKETIPEKTKVQEIESLYQEYPTKAEIEAKVEKLKENYAANPDFNYSAAVSRRFESEDIDESWATPREKALIEEFKTQNYLQGKSLKSIECRSKHCRIQVFFDSPQNINSIAEDIYQISRSEKQRNLFAPAADMGVSLEEKVLSVYVKSDLKATLY